MSTRGDEMKIEQLAEQYPYTENLYPDYPNGWRGYQRDQIKKYCMKKCGKASDSYHSLVFLQQLEEKLKNTKIS